MITRIYHAPSTIHKATFSRLGLAIGFTVTMNDQGKKVRLAMIRMINQLIKHESKNSMTKQYKYGAGPKSLTVNIEI